jgi:glutaconate CoA-transferase subunit A
VQKEALLSAHRSIAPVEEIVDDLGTTGTNAIVLPSWTLNAVALAAGGARPSYAHGYYARDNAFYTAWDAIARDRERFTEWIDANVKHPAGAGGP